MKNLASLLALLAVASLVLLAVAASLGVTLPYSSVALRLVALASVAGVLSIFLADYAPRRPLRAGPALPSMAPHSVSARPARVVVRQRRRVPAMARSYDDTIVTGTIATLGLGHQPVTLSMS
jgi:hypothetical protein